MKKVRWGVLSTANIGTGRVIPAMQVGKYSTVTAIASRDLDKAKLVAHRYGIPTAYGSYEELLADPDVDAIYIPLPNHLHVPWSLRALEAGKHVLCEKPLGLIANEAETLLQAAQKHPHLRVMEAFMYRFHPQWQLTRQMVHEGSIGDLHTVQTFFSYRNLDPANVRNQADIGGGGMLDIGCYCISVPRFLFGSEPIRATGSVEYDPTFDIDRMASGMLEFSKGTATFTCATQLEPYQRVLIFGTQGSIEIEIPFNAPTDRPCKIWHTVGGQRRKITLKASNQYTLQGDAFSQAILTGDPAPTPLEDAVANLRVIDAIFASAQEMDWIDLRAGSA